MRITALTALAGLSLGALLPAQEAAPAPETNKTQAPGAGATVDQQIADHLRQLGADSFRDRTAAERALREIGDAALPALRRAAEADGDAEIQWRARRLIRQIERGDDAGGLTERGPADAPPDRGGDDGWRIGRGALPDDVQRRFDQLFRDLERDFGFDIPRHRFFNDDFFSDIEEQMRALQDRAGAGRPQGMQSQGMNMQMGPDGVRVEIIEKDADGKADKKVYEAPDLETFRSKYPDVLQNHNLRLFGGGGLGGPGNLRFRGFPTLPDGFDFDGGQLVFPRGRVQLLPQGGQVQGGQPPGADAWIEAAPPPADQRLGVTVQTEIPPAVRSYLGLDHGLMVETVQDGTLAAQLGLRAEDIVTRIGGREIRDVADVRAALRAIDAGDDVVVEIVRRGRELELKGTKPAAEAADDGGATLEPRRKDGEAERIR